VFVCGRFWHQGIGVSNSITAVHVKLVQYGEAFGPVTDQLARLLIPTRAVKEAHSCNLESNIAKQQRQFGESCLAEYDRQQYKNIALIASHVSPILTFLLIEVETAVVAMVEVVVVKLSPTCVQIQHAQKIGWSGTSQVK